MTALAILVAAGRGERMGASLPKAFLELGGEPLLLKAARAFEAAPSVVAIVAVVPGEHVEPARRLLAGRVVETLDRSELGAAQTPQGFRLSLLTRAYAEAFRDGVTVTDEAMAVERLGVPVVAVPGSAHNRKLTTPEDLAWAEGVLAAHKPGERA